MLDGWTIGRASGIGASAGLIAIFVWALHRAYDGMAWPLGVLGAVCGLCGISILAITALDLVFHRRRGGRVFPLRIFDLVLGSALVLLCLVLLDDLRGQLPPLW
ncbi:MAG TPA: hypothetical protein VIT45_00085 [Allosphingosinicella sp.]